MIKGELVKHWLPFCISGIGSYTHLFSRENHENHDPHHELGIPVKQPVGDLGHFSLGGGPPLRERVGRQSPERSIASS